MESKDKLEEIDIKNHKYKKILKTFLFMTFHTKLLWVKNHCEFGLIK